MGVIGRQPVYNDTKNINFTRVREQKRDFFTRASVILKPAFELRITIFKKHNQLFLYKSRRSVTKFKQIHGMQFSYYTFTLVNQKTYEHTQTNQRSE